VALDDQHRQPLEVLRRGRYLFASRGDVPHPRRVVDAALVLAAAAGLVVASLAAANEASGEATATEAIDALLGWLEPFWSLVYGAVWLLAVGIVVVSLVGRRWRLARDLLVAIGLVGLGGGLLGLAVADVRPDLAPPFLSDGAATYPAIHIAFVVAVVIVARPDLTRPLRRMTSWLVVLAAVAAVVADAVAPSALLGGAALGLAAGGLVRLILGSSAGFPDRERVLTGLDDLGLALTDLTLSPEQPPGVATYVGRTVEGRAVEVKVYGSDARDAQFLAKVWRAMSYRDAGPEVAYSRLQQVEHESLITLMAARAGVAVPDIVAVGAASSGDALLVSAAIDTPRLNALADDAQLDAVLGAVWRSVGRLQADGIAHGRLNTHAIAVDGGGPVLLGFGAGRLAASTGVLDTDVAELLVSTALLVGSDRALRAALDNLGRDSVARAVPYVQRAALTPALRDEVRRRDFDIGRLRQLAATSTEAELPDVVQLHRVSLRDVVFMALLAVAAYLIISQFADIGFDTIWTELSSAQWEWLVVTLAVAQLIYFTQAVAVQGAIPAPLPYGPTVLLQAALKFIGLTVPTTAGRIALTLRYFQRLGVKPATALASSALDGIAGSFIEIILFLIVWPTVDLDLDLSGGGDADYSGLFWLGVALLACGVVAAIVAIVMPKVRARIVPHLKAALRSLATVFRSPRQLGLLLSGNLGNELVNALALTAASHAYGVGVSVGEALIIAMGVTLFTSIVPVPGGIGVAEAGLTTGLVAVGVPEASAFATALTYRLATYYLPPIWGYVSLRWLSDKGYV
jgi:glycosyltransferase 2 family protein